MALKVIEICPFVVVALAMLFPKLLVWRRRARSLGWPSVKGNFRSGSLQRFHQGITRTGFRATAKVSYRVGEQEFAGEYTEEFGTEEDAAALFESLEQGPLYVRYNPNSPWDYFIDPYRDVRAQESAGSGEQRS